MVRTVFRGLLLALAMLLPLSGAGAAETVSADPAIAAAVKEGNLYIYGAVGQKTAQPLVRAFERRYPGIKVDYIELTPVEVFSSHMRDLGGRKVSADILWSSAINLQAAIVSDGYAQPYRPTVAGSVMPLALLGDAAFVTAFEPVVFVYNRTLVSEAELPRTRALLQNALAQSSWHGKIATVDPEKNELAFLLLTQDLAYGRNFWGLVRKLGDAGLQQYPDDATLLEKVAGGEVRAGFNLPLSAVLRRAATDPALGWFYPTDYTLLLPQCAVITKAATHPQAARLWIDFLLGSEAQQLIAAGTDLLPVDTAVVAGEMKMNGGTLPSLPQLRMIGVGTEVTRFGDRGLRRGFILRWKQLLKLVK